MKVTTFKAVNLPPFLRVRKKASFADLQNGVLNRAHWIYAFLLINLMQLSKHQIQHLAQHISIFTTGLVVAPAASAFYAKYSNKILMRFIVATRIDPYAIVPKWYTNAHLVLKVILAVPLLSLLSLPYPEKYHIHVVAAIINFSTASMKARIQRIPKSMNKKI